MELFKLNEAKAEIAQALLETGIFQKYAERLSSRFYKDLLPVAKKLVKIYAEDMGIRESKVQLDDMLDWIADFTDEDSYLTRLALTYHAELDKEGILKLCYRDPKFDEILSQYAQEYNLYDNKKSGEVILTDILNFYRSKEDLDPKGEDELFDTLLTSYEKGSFVECLTEETEDVSSEVEEQDIEKPEEEIPTVEIETDNVVVPEQTEVETTEEPIIPEEIELQGFSSAIKSNIETIWGAIDSIQSNIGMFELSYKKENKEDIKKILSSLVDDLTIDIGMLHKVSDLIDDKSTSLLSAGEEKAEEIISEVIPE